MSFPRTGNVSLSGLNAARPLSQPRTPTSGLTSTSTIHQNIHSAPGTTNNVLTLQQRDHMVPIAQIPTLARYLYSQLDIGESIPAPLFEAIAKILAWAYETKENDGTAKDVPQVVFAPEQIRKNRPVIL